MRRISIIKFFLLIAIFQNCSVIKPQTDEEIEDVEISEFYLPAHFFKKVTYFENRDSMNIRYYSQFLTKFKEPILFNYLGEAEVYRFTWIRTFHYPICIRLVRRERKIELEYRITDGMGGYNIGELKTVKRKSISLEDWQGFEEILDSANFWNIESDIPKPPDGDGSSWLIEGYKNGIYHLIERASPDEKEDIFKIGKFMIKLSKIKVMEGHMY